MTQYEYNVNGSSLVGNLAWNANGTFNQLAITDPFTASNTQTCNNGYDDLARLVGDNCGSAWSQSFSYDAFGNLGKSGTISFQPTYNSATNHYATLPSGTPAYDANGNVTNDGFFTYNWDADGKNTQIQGSGTVTYDALGRLAEEPTIGYRQPVYSPIGQQLGAVSSISLRRIRGYLAAVTWRSSCRLRAHFVPLPTCRLARNNEARNHAVPHGLSGSGLCAVRRTVYRRRRL